MYPDAQLPINLIMKSEFKRGVCDYGNLRSEFKHGFTLIVQLVPPARVWFAVFVPLSEYGDT
jgi:hypothetical protein